MGELEALRVRDEVLQAMYWMRAEGIDDSPSAEVLARFLAVPPDTLRAFLDRFTVEGYLELGQSGYCLTDVGEELGKRTFADEFAGLTGAAHGECADDCWCHSSPDEAARCLEDRVGHVH